MSTTTTTTTAGSPALTALSDPAAEAAILTACRALLLPTVRADERRRLAARAETAAKH